MSSPESYLNGQNCCFSGDRARAVREGKVKEKAATTGGLPAFCLLSSLQQPGKSEVKLRDGVFDG